MAKTSQKLRNKLNDLKIGNYIFAYHNGVHRVLEIEYPTTRASTALVTYISVLDRSFNKVRNKMTRCCDIDWIEKINFDQLLIDIENSHKSQIDNVKALMKDK